MHRKLFFLVNSSNYGIRTVKITGKERDSETGLDYFGARYYGSTTARFLSPDPEQESGFLYMDDPQA